MQAVSHLCQTHPKRIRCADCNMKPGNWMYITYNRVFCFVFTAIYLLKKQEKNKSLDSYEQVKSD